MSLRTTVEIDQLRNTPKSEEEWVKIHNDLAEKINRLITDLKRSEFGTAGQTIRLTGGGVSVVSAGGEDTKRNGKVNVSAAGVPVLFSTPFPDGSNYILLWWCHNANLETTPCEISAQSTSGFMAKTYEDAILEYEATKL